MVLSRFSGKFPFFYKHKSFLPATGSPCCPPRYFFICPVVLPTLCSWSLPCCIAAKKEQSFLPAASPGVPPHLTFRTSLSLLLLTITASLAEYPVLIPGTILLNAVGTCYGKKLLALGTKSMSLLQFTFVVSPVSFIITTLISL